MAIALDDATANSTLTWADASAIGGLTAITVAWTMQLGASFTAGTVMVSQWGVNNNQQAFVAQNWNTDEVAFVVSSGSGAGTYYGPITTDSPMVANALLRVVVRVNLSPKSSSIWINGAARTVTPWFNNSPASIVNANADVAIGWIPSVAQVIDAQYSEFAIWDHEVADWVAEAYGKGMSPQVYRTGGIFYSRIVNDTASGVADLWGGLTLSNGTGATNAVHPAVHYPS